MTPTDPTAPASVQADTTPAPVLDGTQPSGQPVISTDRDALVKKYEAQYFAPPADTPAVDAVVTETATATPVADGTSTAQVPDRDAVLQSIVAELASLKTQLRPAAPPKAVEPTPDWLALLADGKKAEGEKALADTLLPQIREAAVQEALGRIQLEREVNSFNDQIRSQNADLLPMEAYIAQAANQRIQAATAAGTIKTPADYVTVYKSAVNAEIDAARKLVQQFRGAGKQEAITRTSAVVASPTLQPNAVNMQREAPKANGEPELETPQSYLAKRQALTNAGRGLSSVA